MTKVLIGVDPELFVRRGKKFISAHNLVSGNKIRPYKVRYGAVQPDGVAAEMNTDPASTFEEHLRNIKEVRSQLLHMVRQSLSLREEIELVAVPTAYFDQDYFDTLPNNVKMLGCQPDFNAYTGRPNRPPRTNEPFRTGAGHHHIGWTNDVELDDMSHFRLCCELVKELDRVVYPLTRTFDFDTKRMELYGAPGAFRHKPYGLEYRSISNAFLQSDETIELMYRAVKQTAEEFLAHRGVIRLEEAA